MESWFQPMGRNLRIRTEIPIVRDACAAAFGAFGRGDPGASPDLCFEFSVNGHRSPARLDGPHWKGWVEP